MMARDNLYAELMEDLHPNRRVWKSSETAG